MSTSKIGRRLTWIVKVKLGITWTEFAEMIGTTKQLVSRWKNDPHNPPGDASIAKISRATGVPKAWIKYGAGPRTFGGESPSKGEAEVLQVALMDIVRVAQDALEQIGAMAIGDGDEGLWIQVDQDGVVRRLSTEACGMFDVTPDEAIDHPVYRMMDLEDDAHVRYAISRVSKKKGSIARFVTRHEDGPVQWEAEMEDGSITMYGEVVEGTELTDEVEFYTAA